MIGVASFICSADSCCRFHAITLGPPVASVKYHVSCLSIAKRHAMDVTEFNGEVSRG
jgi:hypothetical protein